MTDGQGPVRGSGELDEIREALVAVVLHHLKSSNEKKAPQWQRRAHAHAYAGAAEAVMAYDKAKALAPLPVETGNNSGAA